MEKCRCLTSDNYSDKVCVGLCELLNEDIFLFPCNLTKLMYCHNNIYVHFLEGKGGCVFTVRMD